MLPYSQRCLSAAVQNQKLDKVESSPATADWWGAAYYGGVLFARNHGEVFIANMCRVILC